jgi:tetratricopeptide (TPR) repeat protein
MNLLLPVNEADDYVELTDLPETAEEALELLRMELVPLRMWFLLLSEYAKRGDLVNFRKILEASADPDIQSVAAYAAETLDQVALLAVASSNLCAEAVVASDPQERQNCFQLAREIHNRADGLALLDSRTWISKGNYHISNFLCSRDPDDLTRALKQFQYAIDDARLARPTASASPAAATSCAVAARVGRAGALYLQGNYRQALEEYRGVLKFTGTASCPSNV